MATFCYNCMNPVDAGTAMCPHCGQAPSGVNPVHQLKTGTLLKNRYLIGKSLGQGGFGITYIGFDTTLDLRVAIKEYYPNGISNRNHEVTDDVTQTSSSADLYNKGKFRFLLEAKTLARFNEEPGVVSIRDFFEANNTAYIVMEYLDGVTLKRFVESRGKISANALLWAMRPVIRSLEKVHAQGLVHRDIGPDNIMVLRNGTLKLLDFGSAREVGGDKSLSVMLKPGYAPEEQYRSKGKQGPWTDVYALCATIYFCLTGVKPEESVERLVDDTLRRPTELGADITPAQESVLLRGMAVRAADRYQSMDELVIALKDQSSRGVASEPPEPSPPADSPKRPVPKKNRLFLPVCVVLTAAILSFSGMKLFGIKNDIPVTESIATTPMQQSTVTTPNIALDSNNHAGVSNLTVIDSDLNKDKGDVLLTGLGWVDGSRLKEAGDYAGAMESYLKGADDGDEVSMFCIGVMYEEGLGVEKDYKKAMEWFLKSADAGWMIQAAVRIGAMFEEGLGTAKDYEKAKEWYSKGIDAGDPISMIRMGNLYYSGLGIVENHSEAFEWYLKAAEKNNLNAMSTIANMYYLGDGVKQDYEKAKEWMNKAAEGGLVSAMGNVAWLYQNGLGVAQDYDKAMEWYVKAADAGDAAAMYQLGWLYEYRYDDNIKAQEWYQKAADAGNEDAKAMLKQ